MTDFSLSSPGSDRQIHNIPGDQWVHCEEQNIIYSGQIWDVQRDTFSFHNDLDETSSSLTRDYITHPGAVAIVVVDDKNRVLLEQQYRHPIGQYMWEIPAGLLDKPGESYLHAAQRELAEETDLSAQKWSILVDFCNSPGSSTETLRVFLAEKISEIPVKQRHERSEEEAHMEYAWVDLDEAVALIFEGKITNVSAVAGLLAFKQAQTQERSLRSAQDPWPDMDFLTNSSRLKIFEPSHNNAKSPDDHA